MLVLQHKQQRSGRLAYVSVSHPSLHPFSCAYSIQGHGGAGAYPSRPAVICGGGEYTLDSTAVYSHVN